MNKAKNKILFLSSILVLLLIIIGCRNQGKESNSKVTEVEIPPLCAHITFDEGKGTLVTEAISGTKGSLVNMETEKAWISGLAGGALHFDGEDDHVIIPNNSAIDFENEDFTVSFLMRWPKGISPGSEHIICKGDYSSKEPNQTGKRWELYISNHKNLTFLVDDDLVSSRLKVSIDPYITGEWIHVAMVRDTGQKQLKLYANGMLQESIEPENIHSNGVDGTGSISNPQHLTIGDAYLLDNPFEGDMDDLRIFRSALTDEQIAALASMSGIASPAESVAQKAESGQKPRIIVTSDGEIDDQCSMIRFLLYANEWDIEGIITSSSQYRWQGHKWPGDDWIEPDLDAYEKVYPNLLKHEPGYPTPDYLRSITLSGNVKAEGEMEEVTAGSQLIVDVLLDETDDRPVWLQAWGGVNTIARALKSIEEEHPEKMEYVANKIRIYLIWEQDATYQDYIKPNWGKYNILTIISDQFLSYFYKWKQYLPENEQSYLIGSWMNENIIKDHGPLCAAYKAHVEGEKEGFDDGDFRSEGDSPAFLHNIITGLRSMESPDWGGWGGRYVNIRDNEWLDPVLEPGYEYPKGRWYTRSAWGRSRLRKNIPNDAELIEYLKPTWRWIEVVQKDFASRADWCVKPYEEANHPPVVVIDHPLDLEAKVKGTVKLSAKGTTDPDGDELEYRWWQYEEADSYGGSVEIQNPDKQISSFVVPADAKIGDTIHIVCEVTDKGSPQLTRYQRVVLTIR